MRIAEMRRALVAIVVLAVALAVVALAFAGRLLVVTDPLPASADAIVVLAGSIPTRVLEAGDLYRSGLAPRVVVTRERLPRGDAVLRARRVHRLVIVTSRPHSRRARLIYQRALAPTVAVTIRPSRYDVFSAARWWRVRRDAKIILYEYERLSHHWLRERWTIKPCGGLRHDQRGTPPARP